MNADAPKSAASNTEATPAKPQPKVSAAKKVSSSKPVASAVSKPEIKPATKKAAEPKKSKKEAKVKVVRDSFTMPQNEYQKIADIKEACLKDGLHVKKSEVLRAGLLALTLLDLPQLKSVLTNLDKIATGRPKKH